MVKLKNKHVTTNNNIMKYIYLLLTLILLSLSNLEAQNPFIGTWEHQENNIIFRVQLYMTDDGLRGNYEKVSVSNGLEIIIFKSNKDIGHGLTYGPVIFCYSNNYELKGWLIDNTISTQTDLPIFTGNLKMDIISSNPTTATWKITGNNESRLDIDNREFSIPTDVVMTKVE